MTMGEKKNSELQLVGAAEFSDLTAVRRRAKKAFPSFAACGAGRSSAETGHRSSIRHVRASSSAPLAMGNARPAEWLYGYRDVRSDATVLSRITLDRAAPIVQIPLTIWHTSVVREPDTLVVEIKPGPYAPNRFAEWAPEEGTERAGPFLRWVTSAETGRRWQE